jgi:uncharacterized protein
VPIPPRVSVVALRTTDLVRSTAFYTALGWELSPASTAAMSLFKTAGSLLLVCTDDLLAELGGQELAAALAGEPTGEAVLSIHVATDGEVDAAIQEAASVGGVVVKRAAPTPLGGSYGVLRRSRRACLGGHPPPALPARDRRAARDPLGRTLLGATGGSRSLVVAARLRRCGRPRVALPGRPRRSPPRAPAPARARCVNGAAAGRR